MTNSKKAWAEWWNDTPQSLRLVVLRGLNQFSDNICFRFSKREFEDLPEAISRALYRVWWGVAGVENGQGLAVQGL